MDWGKAKNILIIALVITNIFLIYNIEKDMFKEDVAFLVQDENVKDVVNILKEKNIKVEGEIPKKVLELPIVDVAYESYKDEKIDKLFNSSNDPDIYVSVVNEKIIEYEKTTMEDGTDKIDTKKAQDYAKEFLKQHHFLTKDAIYFDTQEDGEGYHIIYKQEYNGYFLEPSAMEMVVRNNGVYKFRRIWLKPLKVYANKKQIIPSTKALLKFMSEQDENHMDIVIKSIDLGYRFDPYEISLTNSDRIQSGTALPTWRIILENGESQFISAFENY